MLSQSRLASAGLAICISVASSLLLPLVASAQVYGQVTVPFPVTNSGGSSSTSNTHSGSYSGGAHSNSGGNTRNSG
jgi:hypothetical protein